MLRKLKIVIYREETYLGTCYCYCLNFEELILRICVIVSTFYFKCDVTVKILGQGGLCVLFKT